MGISALQLGDFPSPNYTPANRQVGDVLGIVCHDTESTSASALAWLTNPASDVSAHYLLSEAGGIYRLVQERHIAYHASAFGSDPSKNRNRPFWLPPWAGQPYSSTNQYTIGIELAGFAARGYTAIQYEALGLLCAQLCRTWRLPPTLLPDLGAAARITTHAYLQTDRSDPGALFSWAQFRVHLERYLGTQPWPPEPEPEPPIPPLPPEDAMILNGAQRAAIQAAVWGSHWNPDAADFAIPTAWRDEWIANRWRGAPLAAEQTIPASEDKPAGRFQPFEFGVCCWLPGEPISWTG